ncbi:MULTISPECIES: hypothetical protein [unclassified Lysobacter]|uniref:hypothetical protein n=1 Tax=unclassified Lysobacter TaxID=2635362 RepID=UPI001BE8637D|nr:MULTISPECIES: hypothetical protein [unclassified Lysobacter]MBT2748389.1 hypothetical protein [Lysobacter sp. ISL-42]MBT2749844.1 hypothetical protein [Lysobacter sp. ISL-50]MBT2781172.1 hypothetical protein [Lysobacter sp. ISL-52]
MRIGLLSEAAQHFQWFCDQILVRGCELRVAPDNLPLGINRGIKQSMATRYSKRRFDGTVVHYDSEEDMRADEPPRAGLFVFSGVFAEFSIFYALVGFFISAVVIALTVYGLDLGASWSKPLRFSAVLVAISAVTYLIARTGWFLTQLFFLVVGAIIILSVLGAIVAALWHFA